MTSGVGSIPVTDDEPSDRPAPLTPVPPLTELLFTGGATLLLLPLCWSLPRLFGLDRAELAVGFVAFHGAHLINDPHFAVTYLLFYRGVRQRLFDPVVPRAQRARYWVAGVVAPLGLIAWGMLSIWHDSAASLGAMTQLMFLLVGWHYVKQGFGVLTLLSARRGVIFRESERRLVLAHCFAGWAYAWASPFDPGRHVEEKGVVYFTWAHPSWLEPTTRVLFFASTLALGFALLRRYQRKEALALGPLLGLLSSVWIWTVYSGIDPLLMYVIPALHSVQYLYFVWLLKRGEAHAHEGAPHFGKPVATVLGAYAASAFALGLVLFHLLPGALDAGLVNARAARFTDLGPTPWFAASFTVVNLHHYFMDFAIWRRENAETRFLRA